ncbi:SAM-dependent DNA methyltransferase [Kribbella sp. NBC_01484]|uniref:Eco57I restriction-modification methylase domain-containing protein n=1 Tax=Kribbella sp. NBC_01484 TaxID=2903579 RepID=UPI002E34FCF8|nr:DNA methyltransferase [Kribbella sp. NBC_01484]
MRARQAHRTEYPFAWLELVETDGPFLSRPALKAHFPSGLSRPDDTVDGVREAFRAGFTDWEQAWTTWMRTENRMDGAPLTRYLDARDAWIRTMTNDVLEWGEYARTGDSAAVRAWNLDHSVSVSTAAVLEAGGSPAALLLVVDPTDDLSVAGVDGWSASAVDRAAALLRASAEGDGVRIPVAVVTDGRWWALVWQSTQGSTGSGIFDGALFREEPDLRDAFWALARLTSLAGGTVERRLAALLESSIASAEEITDALGNQVRASVELLVQSFSASHLRAIADGAESPLPTDGHEVYDAAVTAMMRIVFLLFAEANELLPTEQLYREAYAISEVFDRLDERRRHAVGIEGDEALAATYDTWHRLLATSQALYTGATFEDLRMPAYGGSLFDPARFPWLTAANATSGGLRVLVDDRVMFHVLRSVQHAQVAGEDRQVSFRELDVEQIGYVYEGLLGYSARYTDEVIVGLQGPEAGSEPEVALDVLHNINDQADEDPERFAKQLITWIKKDQSGARTRTARQLAKAYAKSGQAATEDEARRRLRPVVGDDGLVEELVGYYSLMRLDPRELPYVVPAGGLLVVETRSRATSGTHYTPRSLAEEVVLHTLEPLVYSPGPLQTADTTRWKLIPSSQILDLKVADIAVGSGAFLVAASRYLGERLLEAWDAEGITRDDSTTEQRKRRGVEARREVIAHCLYGADINQMAVEMCKLSLWLVSLDPDRPFSFVDDKIFCGNSLLGITELRQLRGLHIDPPPARMSNPGFTVDVDLAIQRATEIRHQLASPVTENDAMRSTRAKRQLMKQLGQHLGQLRKIGDAIIAGGLLLGGKKGKALDEAYENLSYALMNANLGDPAMLEGLIDRGLRPTIQTDYDRWQPLHWVLEVPDVMIEHGGFDAIIGNPPFLGGQKLTGSMGENVRDWFVNQLAGNTKGSADLVAYFFLRAFSLIKTDTGQLGLIATNTIAQGDTREVGLDRMAVAGMTIRRAVQSASWPARSANLEYAGVWGSRAPLLEDSSRVADGLLVRSISTLLEPSGRTSGSPVRLVENSGMAFIGSYVLGKGFVLSEDEAAQLLEASALNSEIVFSYLNGDDLNSRPDSSASRSVIDFGTRDAAAASRYELAWQRVERLVRPERATNPRRPRRDSWWRFAERAAGLYLAIEGLHHVLAIARVSKTVMPVRVPTGQVFSDQIVVFASDDYADQAVLSSSLHQTWAIMHGSSLETRVRYTPSDVFDTFARPAHVDDLKIVGKMLDEERAEIMLRRGLGITKVYNLVNDPDIDGDADVDQLREIHVMLDEAVVHAYGWEDVPLGHGYHTYRQMERFTISQAARVELLDRLLEENHRRAATHGEVGGVGENTDDFQEGEGEGL